MNLCPHDVTLMDGNLKLTFKASGQVARLETFSERTVLSLPVADGSIEVSLPLQRITDGIVYGLPEAVPNTMYITSYIVAKHVRRADVISPLTDASAERNEDNKITSVRGFQSFI